MQTFIYLALCVTLLILFRFIVKNFKKFGDEDYVSYWKWILTAIILFIINFIAIIFLSYFWILSHIQIQII